MTAYFDGLCDIRQTPEYAQFMRTQGWQVDEHKGIFVYKKVLPLTILKIVKILGHTDYINRQELLKGLDNFFTIVFKQEPRIVERVENSRVFFKIDPINNWPLLPTKTIWISTKKTEKNLLENLKQKTRYNLRKAQGELTVELVNGDKVSARQTRQFYELWSRSRQFNWLFKPKFAELIQLIASFGRQCYLVWITTKERKLAAVCLVLTSKTTAFYWHNTSTQQGKELFAPTLAVWQALKEAKKRHLSIFDFEGLWDERIPDVNKGYRGFSRFKESFVTTVKRVTKAGRPNRGNTKK